MDSTKLFLSLGALFALLGVAGGAFGAHALKDRLTPEQLAIFEIGVRYQMYHALALVAMGWHPVPLAAWLFVGGIFLFSGSLYILALTSVKAWGAVTPVGGLLFLAGWATVIWSALK